MATKKDVVIAILATFCLTSTLFMILPTRSQEYDPWADLNEDGIVDIFDVVGVTSIYETTGDSTKNVNVTNWQISRDVNVWWGQETVPGGLTSPAYNAGGFGHLHVLAASVGLSGAETLTVNIRARIYNETKTSWLAVTVYTFTLTSTSTYADVSISVPSEVFYFTIPYDAASSCAILLSFYLTWA